MCCVYVLRSNQDGWRYVGMTSRPLDERLQQHNRKQVRPPKAYPPFSIACSETCYSLPEVRQRTRIRHTGNAVPADPFHGEPLDYSRRDLTITSRSGFKTVEPVTIEIPFGSDDAQTAGDEAKGAEAGP